MNPLEMFEKLPVEFGLTAEQKRERLDKIWAEGGEGVILKHKDGKYVPDERRANDGVDLWEKQKKKISNVLGGEGVDAFVTGFKEGGKGTANEGIIGALEFSVVLIPSGRVHVIGRCSNFTREDRIAWTVKNPDGTIGLREDIYNKVAEITGMDVSSSLEHGSASLVHCTFQRWREGFDGKTPDQCTFPEHLLNDLVL